MADSESIKMDESAETVECKCATIVRSYSLTVVAFFSQKVLVMISDDFCYRTKHTLVSLILSRVRDRINKKEDEICRLVIKSCFI